MPSPSYKDRTPLWMTIVILVCMLPVLVYPLTLQSMPSDSLARSLVWFYPIYVLVDGVCAWIVYPQRKLVAWILLALLLLSHLAIHYI